MSAKWVVVVALFASGCGGAFEAASSGSDASTSNDSSLDGPTPDSEGTEGGAGTDGGQSDGGGGGDDSGGQVDGSVDGAPADGGGDASLDAGQDAGEDSGPEAGMDAGKDASEDSGPEAGKDAGPEAGKDAGPGGDGGSWSTVCPVSAPVAGTKCSDNGLQCEYPEAMLGKVEYDISCDEVIECSGGIWTAASFGGTCTPDGVNAAACPATLGAITSGDACPDKGLRCEYPKGVCSCAVSFGGVVLADAGATWTCEPGAGCPMPRPRLGSACGASTTNPACVYEACSYEQICQNSVWQAQLALCALAGTQ